MKTRQKKIYATKKWLIERSAEQASKSFMLHMKLMDIREQLCAQVCELFHASASSGGFHFVKTTDGTEWAVTVEHLKMNRARKAIGRPLKSRKRIVRKESR